MASNFNKVIVLWDYENCFEEEWHTNPSSLESLYQNVGKSLNDFNPDFAIHGQILAFGPGSGTRYRVIQKTHQLKHDIQVKAFPLENKECDIGECADRLIVRNDDCDEALIQRKTDTADKYMALEMWEQVFKGFGTILVISGDRDFRSTIEVLNRKKNYVMLATPYVSDNPTVRILAKATWRWSSLLRGGPPIR